MKVELYRGFKINLGWYEHLVGQYEMDVVAFLENGEYSISHPFIDIEDDLTSCRIRSDR